MNDVENDHVQLLQLRGFSSSNLAGALKEAYAISRGTKCNKHLFSLSLSPPKNAVLSEAAFEEAVDRAETRLGLDGLSRAIVIHEKEGRRHAHAVWSRIDPEKMTARSLPFFKRKLSELSRELYLANGWPLPAGFIDREQKAKLDFTLPEFLKAKKNGYDPRDLHADVGACWERSSDRRSFMTALEHEGFSLAKGGRRGFVIVDHEGEIHSLTRLLPACSSQIKHRLGSSDTLPDAIEVRTANAARIGAAARKHIDESKQATKAAKKEHELRKAWMKQDHIDWRFGLDRRHKFEWEEETKARQARVPRGIAGLWQRVTGKYGQIKRQNEVEALATTKRHAAERQQMIEEQFKERARLQLEIQHARLRMADDLRKLRREVGRFMRLSRASEAARTNERSNERSRVRDRGVEP